MATSEGSQVMNGKRWRAATVPGALRDELASGLGVHPVVAQVLVNRGVATVTDGRAFLESGWAMTHDPIGMAGMREAVTAVRDCLARGGRIRIYGDYDTDGVAGTALLVQALRGLDATVDYYIPDRAAEGYGLNLPAVVQAAADGIDLLITVDCGVTALEEAREAARRGLGLLITDHHEPLPELPEAMAVVNPRRRDSPYPFSDLAGVGVAFKVVQALYRDLGIGAGPDGARPGDEPGDLPPTLAELLDLVALGTIADVVPLWGENRALVREGLAVLNARYRPGLAALAEVAGLAPGENISAGQVAFALAPRLNAAGRLARADAGVELLLAGRGERALELARALDRGNRERQAVEAAILAEARDMIACEGGPGDQHALVLAGEGWHPGVVGIVASRLVEEFYRPVVLLCQEGEEARGSARGIPGFHLFHALECCGDLLERFGGHALAAGLTIKAGRIPSLRRRLNELAAAQLRPEDMIPVLDIDARIEVDEASASLVLGLEALAPFGAGNPAPVLAVTGPLADVRRVGRDRSHLKIAFRGSAGRMAEGIGFRLGELAGSLQRGQVAEGAGHLKIERWNGRERVTLVLKDIRPAGGATAAHDGLVLVDARGRSRREYLEGLLVGGRDVVAVVRRAAGGPAPCGLKTGGLPRLVVLTYDELAGRGLASLEGIAPPAVVALCELPPFEEIPPLPPGELEVHLAYGRGDVVALARDLVRLYPERDGLVELYRVLRSREGAFVLPDLAGAVRGLDPGGVARGLEILAELGLVSPAGNDEAGAWQLAGGAHGQDNREKLDLEASAAFRRARLAREGSMRLARFMVDAPLAELLNRWNNNRMECDRMGCGEGKEVRPG